MRLIIDTTSSADVVVSLDDLTVSFNHPEISSQNLLSVIVDLVAKKKASLTDITAIEINPGPGSFTGLRVGFSVANTLGWYLGIPVNGQKISGTKVVLPKYE